MAERYRALVAGAWPISETRTFADFQRARVAVALAPAEPAAVSSQLPVYDLSLGRVQRERLDANLPWSGSEEQPGALFRRGAAQRVKLRFRGDNSYHWFYPKRSWRLKTRRREPLALGRKVHLVNPKGSRSTGGWSPPGSPSGWGSSRRRRSWRWST